MSAPRWRLAAVVVALVSMATVACGGDDGGAGDGDGSGSGGERVVTLVTYDGYALPEAAAESFRERTGWRIEVKASGDAGSTLSAAILTAGKPEGDVLFGVDNTFLTRAQDSDAFERYRPDALSEVPDELELDDSGRFTPIDESAVCVNADAEWFASRGTPLPSDLASLATEPYRDLLAVENPATSSPGLAFLVATRAAFGDEADAYWRRLRDNGVAVAGSWDDAWNGRYTVNGGDRPLVVSYASSPPAEVVYSDGALVRPESTILEQTCFRQIEFAAVLDGAPHPDAARLLVDEMLSVEWQEQLPLSNFVYPVRTGVTLPEEFTKWAPPVADPMTMDAADIGARRDDWLDAWRDVME